jgi:hypothetical protein
MLHIVLLFCVWAFTRHIEDVVVESHCKKKCTNRFVVFFVYTTLYNLFLAHKYIFFLFSPWKLFDSGPNGKAQKDKPGTQGKKPMILPNTRTIVQ